MPDHLTLYSFRRCPYAMRARFALHTADVGCELREVKLSDKPPEMLAISKSGTVPLLAFHSGKVIEESLDIAIWALQQSDPEGWLQNYDLSMTLIRDNDGDFKHWLDRYKYHVGYPEKSPEYYRDQACEYLNTLERRLSHHQYLIDDTPRLADAMIFPFVRQFANVDLAWWESNSYALLKQWLAFWLSHPNFILSMKKLPPWISGTTGVEFPFTALDNE